MQHEFVNEQPVMINPGPRSKVQSSIVVPGTLSQATIDNLVVRVDINHTWTSDLLITLHGPDGTEVLLVNSVGGSGDNFRNTIFRADAQTSIRGGQPPFRGTFRPEGNLQNFNGKSAVGGWTLEVEDKARQDGGALNRWALEVGTIEPASPFKIDVRFLGGLSPTQQAAFTNAADRWAQIIRGDLPPAIVDGETIDDVLIEAQGRVIDGVGGILGQAGPTRIRPGSMLPVKGTMSFDTADLGNMEANGSLTDVILHEMGHVLGFGTLWSLMGLIVGAGTANPTFVGTNAMREYGMIRVPSGSTPVPVANTGGPGTADGHWRESVFGNELLTGFLSGAVRPLSRMSIGAFEDMGYTVDYDAANDFVLPSAFLLAEMGATGDRGPGEACVIQRTEPVMLPPSAMVT